MQEIMSIDEDFGVLLLKSMLGCIALAFVVDIASDKGSISWVGACSSVELASLANLRWGTLFYIVTNLLSQDTSLVRGRQIIRFILSLYWDSR